MELYRLMSFFEFYELFINKKLKMTKLKLMDDKNEGFGVALRSKIPNTFNLGFLGERNNEKEIFKLIQETSYITCWTKKKESMAMWLLYSKNNDAIRIKTNKRKIKSVIDNYLKQIVYTNHFYSEPNTLMSNQIECIIDEVNYKDFHELKNKIEELKSHYDSKVQSLDFNSNTGKEEHLKILSEVIEKGKTIINNENGILIKSKSFEHEEEVRASINLCFRNDISNDEVKKRFERDENMSDITGTFIMRNSLDNELQNILYLDVKVDDFIEEICFDPRLSEYQKKIYIEILGLKDDDRIVESNIFGSYI